MLICTGDRDALQLVTDHVTVLYPRRGVSDMTRFTPEAVRGEVRPDARAVPRLRRAARRPQRQPAQHPRRRREDRREVGPRVRLARPRWSTGSTRSRARSATRCASTWPACMRNRRLTELVRDVPLDVGPHDLRPRRSGTATRSHQLFDDLQFRVLRERLYATRRRGRARGRRGLRRRRRPARRRRGRAVARRARPRRRAGRRRLRRQWGRGTGVVTGVALAAADGAAAYLDPTAAHRGRRAALAALAGRRRPAEGRCTTPRARCWRFASTAGRIAGVTSDTALAAYLRCPTSAPSTSADLALRYLRRELRADTSRSPASSPWTALDDRTTLGRGRDRARERRPGSGRRVRRRARRARRDARLLPTSNCR